MWRNAAFWLKIKAKSKKKQFKIIGNNWYEFQNLKNKISPNNLAYKYKTRGRSPKYFSDYQNLTDLFRHLRDGDVNGREKFKNQIDFKSDLGEIKKGIQNENQKIK